MKRYALICCLQEAKQLHSKQWARTSVEMAFEVGMQSSRVIYPVAARHTQVHAEKA